MTNREFMYWLQGYFELSDEQAPRPALTVEQVMVIRNHLNLVRKVEKKLEEFPSWLEGFLDSHEGLTAEATDKIKVKLASVFKHEIDPSYKGDQVELNKIHGLPKHNPGGPTVYRC